MKKIATTALAALISVSIMTPAADAKTSKTYEITNLSDFLQEGKEIIENEKKAPKLNKSKKIKSSNSLISSSQSLSDEELSLVKKTSPEVFEQYSELLETELANFKISEDESAEGDSEVTYILPQSGAEITVTATDELSNDVITESSSVNNIQALSLVSRPFGTYSYKIAYAIRAIGYSDSKCGLVTTYTAKSDGLRLTSTSTAGTFGIFPTNIVASSKAIDTRAEKIEYDINAQGNYKVTIGGYNGIGIATFDMSITSTVRWDAKTSTSLHVTQKYTQMGDRSQ